MVLLIILRCLESIIFLLTGYMLFRQKTKLTQFRALKTLIILNHIGYVINIVVCLFFIMFNALNLWLIQLGNADYFGLETSLSKVLLTTFIGIIIYVALCVAFKKFIYKLENLMNNISKQTVVYCTNCGTAINSMMDFCNNCGNKISINKNEKI